MVVLYFTHSFNRQSNGYTYRPRAAASRCVASLLKNQSAGSYDVPKKTIYFKLPLISEANNQKRAIRIHKTFVPFPSTQYFQKYF